MRLLSSIAVLTLTLALALPAKAEKLTVMLDWFINPDHAPLIIAEERGIFEKYGLEVELIAPADPADPPKLVAAGRADIAVSYQISQHIQVDAGLPVMRIGTLVATPLNTLLVLADGPVQSIGDLKGRKVGFSVGGVEDIMMTTLLEPYGLTLDDITMINVNFNLSPSLITGQVDAVIGAYRNFELNQLAIEGYKGKAFYIEEHGVPTYDELIYVAHKDKLGDPRLGKFLDAVEEATAYVINHPQESWDIFRNYGAELDDELNRRAWIDTLPRFALRPRALDAKRYHAMAQFLAARGLIEKADPVSAYAIELPFQE
ncbi:MAG: ABC transporter substrate-binding protein [Alphaproteobacteria bacterium]|nr:ABC transporter substrate-binding protein [Alphaproteobacteria bacterium]